uniref:Amino acid transporter transmembrane domain-containing protein n=1 Tax=Rhodosorus marinus TaxID=101924 RepID=A0A7S0G337_9RHOD|mmetsp:Transcript_17420/g.24991  ORF Transcript_17420/g.24991 Transcript_17420/m.24991 type:complete len:490 (+) Transcript_17420:293-1762(+)
MTGSCVVETSIAEGGFVIETSTESNDVPGKEVTEDSKVQASTIISSYTSGNDDIEADEKEGDAGHSEDGHAENLTILLAFFLLMVDMVGNGVLSFPNSFATLGWIPAHLINVLCAVLTICSGLILHRLRTKYLSSATSYPQLFLGVFGKRGLVFARCNTYPLLFLMVSAFNYTQASAWNSLFTGSSLSLQEWMVIAAVVSLLVLQARSFKAMALTSVIAIMTIIIPIFISFVVIGDMVRNPDLYPVGNQVLFSEYGLSQCMVATMDIVYAYSGIVIFLEIMSSMKYVARFKYVLILSQMTCCALYALVGSVVYGLAGDASWLESPYIDSLEPGAAKTVSLVCIVIHAAIGMLLGGNIFSYAAQRAIEPRFKRLIFGKKNGPYKSAPLTEFKPAAMLWWLLWTTILMAFIILVNVAIPSFQTYLGFVSSILVSQTCFIWPGLLDLKVFLKKREGKEHLLSALSVFLILIGFFALTLGLWGDIQSIVELSR